MFYRFLLILLGIFLCTSTLVAQRSVNKHQDTLRKIRNEILTVERELQQSKEKESSVLYLLTTLELDIDLSRSVISNLKKERRKKEKQIAVIGANLKETEEELERLKQQLSKRLIYSYKYGRMKEVELLFTTRSLNDGLLWIEYQKRLSRHDYRSFLKIKEKQNEIARNRDLLTIELEEKKELLRDKVKQEKKLKSKKSQRQQVLAKIRKNTHLLRQQLAAKEKAAKEITRLIVQMEQTPQKTPLQKPNTLFADLKGHMLWPAEGSIVTKFGKYMHPELKTFTENIGIDISARLNDPVNAVASGKVTAITWQRGRGNIVILRHYGGYYSVYAHLGEILINMSEDVTLGQKIGNVGESGSINGPILHFEIWKGANKINPENWLGKNT